MRMLTATPSVWPLATHLPRKGGGKGAQDGGWGTWLSREESRAGRRGGRPLLHLFCMINNRNLLKFQHFSLYTGEKLCYAN